MDISAVNVHVNVALASLQGMKVDTYLGEFFKATALDGSSYKSEALINSTDYSKQEFLELRDSYLDSLIDHLQERLCNNSTEVLDMTSVFLSPTCILVVVPSLCVGVPTLQKELVKLTPLMAGCYSGLRFAGL